ncbi:MAG: hypothetical protein ACTSU5_17765 [Promethearchaeota archaeon]
MQIFRVLPSFETEEVREGKLGEVLSSSPGDVFIVIDPEHNKIWYYPGPEAPLPVQILGKKLLDEYRAQLKLFFKVDDPFGINQNVFRGLLEKEVVPGKCTEVRREGVAGAGGETTTVVTGGEESPAGDREGGKKSLLRTMKEVVEKSRAREVCVHRGVNQKLALRKIKKTIENRPVPPNLERELVICEGKVFVPVTEVQSFLVGGGRTKETLKEACTLQDGFFFLEDRSCRLISEKGRVVGLELFVEREALPTIDMQVPILYVDRLMFSRSVDLLKRAFHIPEHLPDVIDDE